TSGTDRLKIQTMKKGSNKRPSAVCRTVALLLAGALACAYPVRIKAQHGFFVRWGTGKVVSATDVP
ncbi:MAG TPA: hypothetical protein PL002_08115, partial [Flavobacteriales bacterium]|nr:hypothetical protein [Flavobacteriales bacterium]